jgi:NADH dehydrogenase [ubiquinone] 1 alpha subcomplex assembly factor 7
MTTRSATEQALRARISAQGSIGLDEFMEIANAAYYAAGDAIGAAGDFITAPEISQCFGELIGLWAAVTWQSLGSPASFNLVELGPGRGTLMADALRAAEAVPGFRAAARIHLIERSMGLIRRQRQALEGRVVQWHGAFADVPAGPVIAIANEFLDALPIRQWERKDDRWNERRVGVNDAGAFLIVLQPGPLGIPAHVSDAPGSIYEDSPAVDAVAAQLAARVVRDGGAVLFIDYGYDTAVAGDTFQAVHRHRYADGLADPGARDLTAHVNFTAIATAARKTGARVWGPVEQGAWLRRLGIDVRATRLAEGKAEDMRAAILAGTKRLTDPRAMGSLFKVMAIAHPSLSPLEGFTPSPDIS